MQAVARAAYPLDEDNRALFLGRSLLHIWEDQAAFNLLFRQPPADAAEMADQVRDWTLYTESELHELLGTTEWKRHRRISVQENRAHRFEEGADVLKCVLSVLQVIGMTPEDAIEQYWRKTAVVRNRYAEEWTKRVEAPSAIIDIDSVLADYITGICDWLLMHCNEVDPYRIACLRDRGGWVNARSVGLSEERWQYYKHRFRISGAKRHLPVYADAKPFLERLHDHGLQIILLTSRPIDRYPNLYTDTLLWLQDRQLPFDFIWWSHDKAERVLDGRVQEHIHLVVDDDPKYINQFSALGLSCYWLTRHIACISDDATPNVQRVSSLSAVLDHYDTFGKR